MYNRRKRVSFYSQAEEETMLALILAIIAGLMVAQNFTMPSVSADIDINLKTPVASVTVSAPKKGRKNGKSATAVKVPKVGEKTVNRRYRKPNAKKGRKSGRGGEQMNGYGIGRFRRQANGAGVLNIDDVMFDKRDQKVEFYGYRAGVAAVVEPSYEAMGLDVFTVQEPRVVLPLLNGRGVIEDVIAVSAWTDLGKFVLGIARKDVVNVSRGRGVYHRALDVDLTEVQGDFHNLKRFVTEVHELVVKREDGSQSELKFHPEGREKVNARIEIPGVVVDNSITFRCFSRRCKDAEGNAAERRGMGYEEYLMSNGRPAWRARCEVCHTKLNRIVKQDRSVPRNEFLAAA